MRNIFISYSWDGDEHQEWVRKLADSLEVDNEYHVVWDGYDL
ncbi:SEFIR domain-containing protein [Pectobacterium brasiliense]